MQKCAPILNSETILPEKKPSSSSNRLPPLCIDLDGTLVKTDTVWEAAREKVVANAPVGIRRRLAEQTRDVIEFSPQRSRLPALLRALRCHQWSKNILVFLPLLAAHAYFSASAVVGALAMFVAWC